jgi:hypothetical protein
MDVPLVALVSQTAKTKPDVVAQVAAALDRQVQIDLARHWPVRASVHAFSATDRVPPNSWVIMIRDDIGGRPDVTGYHLNKRGLLPYALVEYSDSWSLAASHELLEMLVDPQGTRLELHNAPEEFYDPHEKVQYLIEICDPCQSELFSYRVNSVMVSDFVTPQYYDPVPSPSAIYSFTGAVRGPRRLLRGGYLSFRDQSSGEMLEWKHGERPTPIGTPEPGAVLRSWVDARTSHPDLCGVPADSEKLAEARASEAKAAEARAAIAAELQAEIDDLLAGATGW